MKNPFGDEPAGQSRKPNPFGEVDDTPDAIAAANRIEHAARKLRNLRSQIGAEGLSIPATRELIEEIAIALDAAARALRDLGR